MVMDIPDKVQFWYQGSRNICLKLKDAMLEFPGEIELTDIVMGARLCVRRVTAELIAVQPYHCKILQVSLQLSAEDDWEINHQPGSLILLSECGDWKYQIIADPAKRLG